MSLLYVMVGEETKDTVQWSVTVIVEDCLDFTESKAAVFVSVSPLINGW